MTQKICLAGCSPVPLAAYLKALGVLRVVGEQADPEVRGYWERDRFVVLTAMAPEQFRSFWLATYRPTPILAPWNGGSGFYPIDNKSGIEPIATSTAAPAVPAPYRTRRQSGIEPIATSTAERFAVYREAIGVCRRVLRKAGLIKRPEPDSKSRLLTVLRSEIGEESLVWYDAAVLLGADDPSYPPLLGTGGNDGRLDFTNNFMQHLVALFDTRTGEPLGASETFLDQSLFGRPSAFLLPAAIGQFSPGNAGGVNQGSGFGGASLVNPWDFVLMLEGAVLFAAAATRRLESGMPGTLSYPFTVRPTGTGEGATAIRDASVARAEMWLPLWSGPASLREIKMLLAEGRATLGGRAVRDGLDFVQAVSRLGVDRGITHFQRFAFLERAGKAYLATPLNRVRVTRNPSADLADQLERNGWLRRFRQLARSGDAPARIEGLVSRLENALFLLAAESRYRALRVQQVLQVLGEAHLYLGCSRKAREVCPPVPSLSSDWIIQAEDGSPELAIAAALAGLHARKLRPDGSKEFCLPMRAHLAPEKTEPGLEWTAQQTHQVTWGPGSLEANLARTVSRRLLAARRLELKDKPFDSIRVAPVAAVAGWLADTLDSARISALLPGLSLVRLDRGDFRSMPRLHPLPVAYRLLKPFFCTDAQLRRAGLLQAEASLELPSELVRLVEAGRITEAVRFAERRLRVAGIRLRFPGLTGLAGGPQLLIAALLVPITDFELRLLLPRKAGQEVETQEPR